MTKAEVLKGIREAARKRGHADAVKSNATADLRRYCKAAQKKGVSISQIAREAELSRQGVYDLIDQRPSR